MVATNIIPRAKAPASAIVLIAKVKEVYMSPVITSYIVLYMPAPGTKGIKQHITIVVTGVFKILANISE